MNKEKKMLKMQKCYSNDVKMHLPRISNNRTITGDK